MKKTLFEDIDSGATFNKELRHRYVLWRIWDYSKPIAMVIGLNPSLANENKDDPTIKSVIRLTTNNGFGGFFMMNLYTFITPYPAELKHCLTNVLVDKHFKLVQTVCDEVIFCWGNF